MFGFIIPNLETLSQEEKTRYQSVYCGLCHSLRDNYSNISRLALNYDLTFLVLLLSSLYEPKEHIDNCKCIFHPGSKYQYAQNEFSDYCADITVALAYHKIIDDVRDEGKIRYKIGSAALKNQYNKVKHKLPKICNSIEETMNDINKLELLAKNHIEKDTVLEIGDTIAKTFGMIMAKIFSPKDDIWKESLSKFGANLGRFIYFMDAAIDLEKDKQKNSYNPYMFYNNNNNEDQIKKELSILAGKASEYFEKLPLEQDIQILQNIIYEGSWIMFNHNIYKK